MVKVGIKSNPGINSSIKLNIPPKNPFLNPNMRQKTTADIGAQISSPNTGIIIVALPIKSMIRQAPKEGSGFD